MWIVICSLWSWARGLGLVSFRMTERLPVLSTGLVGEGCCDNLLRNIDKIELIIYRWDMQSNTSSSQEICNGSFQLFVHSWNQVGRTSSGGAAAQHWSDRAPQERYVYSCILVYIQYIDRFAYILFCMLYECMFFVQTVPLAHPELSCAKQFVWSSIWLIPGFRLSNCF